MLTSAWLMETTVRTRLDTARTGPRTSQVKTDKRLEKPNVDHDVVFEVDFPTHYIKNHLVNL